VSQPNSVIEPIEKSWHDLTALVDSLGAEGLTVTGADGWAVKDHLAHVAAWEASLIALFEGTDRGAAMGISATGEEGTDEINHSLWSHHHDMTSEQALAYFHNTHARLIGLLSKMSDEDLQRPYNDFQPNDPRAPDDNRPAMDWVAGNTWEHYAEHAEWLGQLINDSRAAS
jgi:hypothetical protein